MKKIGQLLRRLEMNRAVSFNILSQIWGGLAGPVTMLVIAQFFSPEQQGYYYTFNSVLALQIFVELGLVTVLIQFASHEWAFLELDNSRRIRGDKRALSRLSSVMRFGVAWYAISGALVAIGLSVGGYSFFSVNASSDVNWQAPWLALSVITGLLILVTPFSAVLEGCNQVGPIYGLRLFAGILSSLTIITSMVLGAGLYALPLSALTRLLCGMVFLAWKYRRFYAALLTNPISERVSWRTEMLPFQWRIAVTWAFGYFPSIVNPVIFHYHGAEAAGQIGMTISLTSVIPSMAYSWVQTRVPQFGSLIARAEYGALDNLFKRLATISAGIAVAGSMTLWLFVAWLQESGFSIAHRILPLLPTTLLIILGILNTLVFVLAMYLRAHKREPLLIASVVTGILIGTSVWVFGAQYGSLGAVAAYLTVIAIWTAPSTVIVFARCRTDWHAPKTIAANPDRR